MDNLTLFSLAAKLTLDKAGFDKGVDDADKAGRGLADNLQGYAQKVKGFIDKLALATTLRTAVKGIWNLAKETSDAGDKIDKNSQALGLSRKAYQEWGYILSQCGADIDSMGIAMKTMSSAIAENSAETAAGLAKLGLSSARLQSLTPEQQLEEIVKAFQEMPDGTEKAQLAMKLFGKSAQSMMPLLNSASGTVDNLRDRAHELGLIMSDEDIDASVAFGDALSDLTQVWTAVKQKFGAQMLPGFTNGLIKAANALGRISNALTNAFKTGDFKEVFSIITDEVSKLVPSLMDTVLNVLGGIFDNADKLIDLAASILTGLADAISKSMPKLVSKLPQIWATVKNAMKSIALSIGNGLIDTLNALLHTKIPHIGGDTSWVEIGKQILNAIWQGLKNANVAAKAQLAEWLKITDANGNPLDGDKVSWFTIGTKIIERIWNGLKNANLAAKGSLATWLKITNDNGDPLDPSEVSWLSIGGKIIEKIWDGLGTATASLKNSLCKWLKITNDNGDPLNPDEVSWWDVGSKIIEKIWQGLGIANTAIKNQLFKWLKISNENGEPLNPEGVSWLTIGSKVLEKIWDGLSSANATVKNHLCKWLKLTTDNGEPLNPEGASWLTIGSKVIEKIWNGLGQLNSSFKNGLSKWLKLTDANGNPLNPEKTSWFDIGKGVIQKIKDGAEKGTSTLKLKLGKILGLTDEKGNLADETGWQDIGKAAINKVKEGFKTVALNIGATLGIVNAQGKLVLPDWMNEDIAAKLTEILGKFGFVADDGTLQLPEWLHTFVDYLKERLIDVLKFFGFLVDDANNPGEFKVQVPTWIKALLELRNILLKQVLRLFGVEVEQDKDGTFSTEKIQSGIDDILQFIKDILRELGFVTEEDGEEVFTIPEWIGNTITGIFDILENILEAFGFVEKTNDGGLKFKKPEWLDGLIKMVSDIAGGLAQALGFVDEEGHLKLPDWLRATIQGIGDFISFIADVITWIADKLGISQSAQTKNAMREYFTQNYRSGSMLDYGNADDMVKAAEKAFGSEFFIKHAKDWQKFMPYYDPMLKSFTEHMTYGETLGKETTVYTDDMGVTGDNVTVMASGDSLTFKDGTKINVPDGSMYATGIRDALMNATGATVYADGTIVISDGAWKTIYSPTGGAHTRRGRIKTTESDSWGDVIQTGDYSAIPNAKGLNYVPYDGYIAELHRGETVLNQDQGRKWRNGELGNGFDMNKLYKAVADAVAAVVGGIEINMDGTLVGNAVTPTVSRNIWRQANGRRFG